MERRDTAQENGNLLAAVFHPICRVIYLYLHLQTSCPLLSNSDSTLLPIVAAVWDIRKLFLCFLAIVRQLKLYQNSVCVQEQKFQPRKYHELSFSVFCECKSWMDVCWEQRSFMAINENRNMVLLVYRKKRRRRKKRKRKPTWFGLLVMLSFGCWSVQWFSNYDF